MPQEASLEKIRLMALLSVASRAAGGAVALSEVQAALDIPEDQVGAASGCGLPWARNSPLEHAKAAACIQNTACIQIALWHAPVEPT